GVTPAGLVSAGFDSAGLTPAAGVGVVGVNGPPGVASEPGVVPGLVRPGLVRPGVPVRPGLVRPGVPVRPGLVRPGLPKPGLAALAPARLGTFGRLMPNCDSPCESAPISSLGRSV